MGNLSDGAEVLPGGAYGLLACRLCGHEPWVTTFKSVRCSNCGLTVKNSAAGQGDGFERWNSLNAPAVSAGGLAAEVAQEVALCEALRVGLKPGGAYRFVARRGCAKCEAWAAWNALARGEGPVPQVPHPLVGAIGACAPAVRAETSLTQRLRRELSNVDLGDRP